MRYATIGPITVQHWLENANLLRRHFFNAPRQRIMQQGRVYGRDLPLPQS